MLWVLTPALQIYNADTFNQGFYFFLLYHRLEIRSSSTSLPAPHPPSLLSETNIPCGPRMHPDIRLLST